MKTLLFITCIALLLLTSCAATYTISGHAPTQDNSGTCANPVLIPTAGGLVRIKLQYAIGNNVPAAQIAVTPFRDSVAIAPGLPFTFSGNIPSNTYTFMATTFDSLGNASCGAVITKLVRGSFSEVPDLK